MDDRCKQNEKTGNLVIVGTGILTPAHLSQESIAHIKSADIVHALVPDPLGFSTIQKLNDNIKNLDELYYKPQDTVNGSNRIDGYNKMVESIMSDVRDGLNVCAVFYGHPGVFVNPSHASIKQARSEGFEAKMLPSISAEDCLFADLGVDPGYMGCQAYEATQFMFYKHSINIHSALVLWQIGAAGDESMQKFNPAKNGLAMLKDRMLEWYPENHEVILYEATTLPIIEPRTEKILLANLTSVSVKTITTMYIPPVSKPELNLEFCKKWGVDTQELISCSA
ncbi:SAM-dependent methyltransferase [Aliikangiella coralliicola]|uniref:Methylase n=1 Tax=Aliikangiella coralliicola TaxID=2592383 RepID=A0A545UGS2_9GAMM|nr:SAM-dependent methyltransferase [Aliikangiella coralliicola]TQV88645.1 methylase [Aliikangiella coralliicola]